MLYPQDRRILPLFLFFFVHLLPLYPLWEVSCNTRERKNPAAGTKVCCLFAQRSFPQPPAYPAAQVRKLYDKLQRNARNRIAATAGGSSSEAAQSQSGARAPPPSFVPPPPPAVAGVAGVEEPPVVAVGTPRLDNGDVPAAGAPACGPVAGDASSPRSGSGSGSGGCYRGGGGGGSDGGDGLSALQVGERLSDAVRLCSSTAVTVGGVGAADGAAQSGSLRALTLSEAELSRPRSLLDDLRFMTCRPAEEAAVPTPTSEMAEERSEVEGGQSKSGAAEAPGTGTAPGTGAPTSPPPPPTPVGQGTGFLGLALAQDEVGRADALAAGYDPLMETAWLAERFPKVTLGDLLANRLELSLWASYWNRGRSRESVG